MEERREGELGREGEEEETWGEKGMEKTERKDGGREVEEEETKPAGWSPIYVTL